MRGHPEPREGSNLQEFEFIKRCTDFLPSQAEGLLCGIGDDCAVISGGAGRDWLISTDGFFEKIHFCRDWMSAKDIGRRCLISAVSDIAAMGGRPRFVTVSISVPPTYSADDAADVMSGISSSAASYQMVVIGGDTCAAADDLSLTLTVIGDIRHGAALYRRGAKLGDVVYVTGALGGSLVGLQVLQKNSGARGEVVDRFLHPAARVTSGLWLADTGCVTSMIDVSDGLIQDLGHIAQASGVGIVVDADAVPCWHGANGTIDLNSALTSGEEYELAFTVDGRRDSAFQRLLPAVQNQWGHAITRIGVVVSGSGVLVRDPAGTNVTPPLGGFSHSIGKVP